ncbi:MAG: 50S ribosomal protein L4 [Phycisphaerae bacterium]
MLDVPVYNTEGKKVDTLQVDEALFGGEVNAPLLKQAIVAYQARRRQGTVKTRGRGEVVGSTRKLYRQKGTGYARRGQIRTNVMRGGGVAFGKRPHKYNVKMPQKMKRAALKSAILAKLLGEDCFVLEAAPSMDAPRTKTMASLIEAIGINRTCTLAMGQRDHNVYLSSRNIKDLTVRTAAELNAYDVAMRQKLILTRDAFDQLSGQETEA